MDVTVSLECNNRCRFCCAQEYLSLIVCFSLKNCLENISLTRENSDGIVLSGGEITLNKDIFKILAFCRSLNFKRIGIVTNGRLLEKISFTEDLIKAGINDFAVSIYSVVENTHDYITQVKGSCLQTTQAIKNLVRLQSSYVFGLRINIVLNYFNYAELENTILTLSEAGIKHFIIAEQIVLDASIPYLSSAMLLESLKTILKLKLKATELVIKGFAPCFFSGNFDKYGDSLVLKRGNPKISMELHDLDTFVGKANQKKVYLEKFAEKFVRIQRCKGCKFIKSCRGIQKIYLPKRGV